MIAGYGFSGKVSFCGTLRIVHSQSSQCYYNLMLAIPTIRARGELKMALYVMCRVGAIRARQW